MTAPTPGPWATEGSVIWAPEAAAVIAQASELRTNETVRNTDGDIEPHRIALIERARAAIAAAKGEAS